MDMVNEVIATWQPFILQHLMCDTYQWWKELDSTGTEDYLTSLKEKFTRGRMQAHRDLIATSAGLDGLCRRQASVYS